MEQKKLITAQEVVDLAFPSSPRLNPAAVGDYSIVAAQEKYLRPALGGLYNSLCNGDHPELLDNFIKPTLAFYVKLMLIPMFNVGLGSAGIVQGRKGVSHAANRAAYSALVANTRSHATELMRLAIEKIESEPEQYPEYDPEENIMSKINSRSGIIL